MAAGRVELSLLGQTLTVRTEASPEYVRRLAAYLEERVTELRSAGIKDPLASLTLAALDITDELFRIREDKTRQDGDVCHSSMTPDRRLHLRRLDPITADLHHVVRPARELQQALPSQPHQVIGRKDQPSSFVWIGNSTPGNNASILPLAG